MLEELEAPIQRLHALRERGVNPYPNRVERTHTIQEILNQFDELELAGPAGDFTLVGRVRFRRKLGKITFLNIEDTSGRIQLYLGIDEVGEEYQLLKLLDIGDIIQVRGYLFKTP